MAEEKPTPSASVRQPRRGLADRVCARCSAIIPKARADRRYCNQCVNVVRIAHVKRIPPSVCRHCGETFQPTKSAETTYCSRQCYFDLKRSSVTPRPQSQGKCCPICLTWFLPSRPDRMTCSEQCKRDRQKRHYKRVGIKRTHCLICATTLPAQKCGTFRKYCSQRCRNKATLKRNRALYRAQRKANKKLHTTARKRGEKFLPEEVFERDNWTCLLCGKKVDRKAKVPQPLAPTLDHIIPITNGGPHTRDNVQCAHFVCNIKASNGGGKQLLLFG
jgi:hypothetical protein